MKVDARTWRTASAKSAIFRAGSRSRDGWRRTLWLYGRGEDGVLIQIAVRCPGRADAHRPGGQLDMEGVPRRPAEYTATVSISSSRQARRIRTAISPRLAIKTRLNMAHPPG